MELIEVGATGDSPGTLFVPGQPEKAQGVDRNAHQRCEPGCHPPRVPRSKAGVFRNLQEYTVPLPPPGMDGTPSDRIQNTWHPEVRSVAPYTVGMYVDEAQYAIVLSNGALESIGESNDAEGNLYASGIGTVPITAEFRATENELGLTVEKSATVAQRSTVTVPALSSTQTEVPPSQ